MLADVLHMGGILEEAASRQEAWPQEGTTSCAQGGRGRQGRDMALGSLWVTAVTIPERRPGPLPHLGEDPQGSLPLSHARSRGATPHGTQRNRIQTSGSAFMSASFLGFEISYPYEQHTFKKVPVDRSGEYLSSQLLRGRGRRMPMR